MTLVVGLTGGIGSGKTAVSDRFQALGVNVVDADVVARIMVAKGRPALTAIAEHFNALFDNQEESSESILLEDGCLNRALLRKTIFANPAERQWLEALLHPLILAEIAKRLENVNSSYSLLVSPLLMETGQNQYAHRILVVDVPEHIQLARTITRDGNTEAEVKAIMAAQTDRDSRRAYADDIIVNDGSLESLQEKVEQLHQQYLQLAAELQ